MRGFNISNIAMIKVVKDDFFGGFGNSNGAILLYTKNGNATSGDVAQSMMGLQSFSLQGYDQTASFNNLNQSQADLLDKEDLRSLLYWNPSVETSLASSIIFYNNAVAKQFRLVIYGLTPDNPSPIYQEVTVP